MTTEGISQEELSMLLSGRTMGTASISGADSGRKYSKLAFLLPRAMRSRKRKLFWERILFFR